MFRLEGDARVIEGRLDMNSYPRKRSRDADEQGAAVREKRRQPRKVNPANPVKKLTTGLLETYKAINQVSPQRIGLGEGVLHSRTSRLSIIEGLWWC